MALKEIQEDYNHEKLRLVETIYNELKNYK